MRFVRRAAEDFAETFANLTEVEVIVAEKTVFQPSFTLLYETSAENTNVLRAIFSGALKAAAHAL